MDIENNYEIPEELRPAEIAELLQQHLDPEMCSDIAECDSAEEAVGLAITALNEIESDDPLSLLQTLGIIEGYDEDED